MAGWPTTVDAMAEKVLRQLSAYYRDEFATLASAVSTSAAWTLTTGHASALKITVGDLLECEAELGLVTEVSGDVLTVTRGYAGTTAAAHDSGSVVRVSPRVSRQDVYEAMESVIMSWQDLYKVREYTASVSLQDNSLRSAEVTSAPAEYKSVLKTLFKAEDDVWVSAPKNWFVRSMPSSEVTSRLVFQWEQNQFERNHGTRTLYVFLAEYFDTSTFAPDTDLISTVGLGRSMLDVLYYGTMFFVLMPEETQRADFGHQAQPRDAQEIPPGFLAQTALSFKVLHDQRKQIEAAKLAERWAQD